VVTLALCATVSVAQPRLAPEDVANLRLVSAPRLSPDGGSVVYVQTLPRNPDEEQGPNRSMLWVVAAGGGEPHAFTSPQGRADDPRFSPDGRSIAFLDHRPFDDDEAKAAVFVIPVDGGEARRLTDAEESVQELAWAADGESIFFTSRDPESEERKEAEEKGRDWEVVDQDHRHLRLYEVELDGGEARRVSDAELTLRDIAVSPDGKAVAALAARTPRVDDSYVFVELVRIDVATGEVEVVWDMPGKAARPRFSPDGTQLAVLAGVAAHDPLPGSVFLVPAGGGEPRNLTPDYPGTVEWIDFDADGRLILVATHGVWTRLERLAPETGALEVLVEDGPVYTVAHLAAGRLVADASTPAHPDEVFVRPLGGGEWTRLTHSYPGLEAFRLGNQVIVDWQARDGLRIEGLLVYPLDYQEGRRYPLVVGVHGGPESALRNGWHTGYGYLSQLLAHRGAFFLMPNYRGSSGRGVGFLLADHGDPVGDEFQDVLDGVSALVERGLVDPDRVGIMGGSYGGYFSGWGATKHSDRFRAAVVNFGVSNLWSDWGDGDIPWEHRLVHWGWFPADRPMLAMDRSPVSWVRGSRTPTLIMHGKDDPRVPAAQSRELYQGLLLNDGLPVELVLFPREGHGYREAPHRLEACRRALAWMETHLGLSGGSETPSGP
jgi:dipeptidyl aminopeptidase/acylaminoacyl peptidase